MNLRFLLFIPIVGFLIVGGLLVTNHWGVAIKVSNYIFFSLLAIFALLILKNEDNK